MAAPRPFYRRERILVGGRDAPALAHHGNQQRIAPRERLCIQTDDILREFSVSPQKAENLLAPGISYFFLAELCGAAHSVAGVDFDEFVNHADVRRIRRSGKRRAHPKRIDARAALQENFDALLVQLARGENLHITPPSLVEALTRPPAVGQNVAAVEANAAGLASERNDFLDGFVYVVSIHEKRGLLREHVQKVAERFGFILVSHDPRVRLGAVHGNAEAAASVSVRRAFATADECGTRGKYARLHAMSAARAEFHDWAPRRSGGDTRCLAGNESLEMENAEQAGFDELRIGDGSGDAKKRLAGKENRSFGQSPNVASKLKTREIIKEIGMDIAKKGLCAQIGDVFVGKAHILQELEGLLESCGHEVIAMAWEGANKKFKRGASVEAFLDVAGRHGEFVEVGEQPGEWSAKKHVPKQIMPASPKGQRGGSGGE